MRRGFGTRHSILYGAAQTALATKRTPSPTEGKSQIGARNGERSWCATGRRTTSYRLGRHPLGGGIVVKHALIVGHPDPNSFTMAMVARYAQTITALGHQHVVRDLYRMDFDPRLRLAEMPDRPIWSTSPDAAAERALLKDVNVFAFIYPLWFNSPPAIVKGYIDRIFGAGFGYAQLRRGGHEPMLSGRQLISITASGSSSAWLNEQGSWESLRSLFDTYLGRICGLRVRPHIHFDSIVPSLASRWIDTNLMTLETRLTEYFGEPVAETI